MKSTTPRTLQTCADIRGALQRELHTLLIEQRQDPHSQMQSIVAAVAQQPMTDELKAELLIDALTWRLLRMIAVER
jgi:hypothetical protein